MPRECAEQLIEIHAWSLGLTMAQDSMIRKSWIIVMEWRSVSPLHKESL